MSATIKASAQVNPSESKRPSPLVLRVYELKSAAGFNNADFMALYQRDQTELSADILHREEFVVAPGESRLFSRTLKPETRYIGVLAAYRDVEHAKWRSVVSVPPQTNQQLLIQADALTVDARITTNPK